MIDLGGVGRMEWVIGAMMAEMYEYCGAQELTGGCGCWCAEWF